MELLGYIDARKYIYLPTYKWILENKVSYLVERIKNLSQSRTVILLDYATNPDVEDGSKPLSHAALIKAYIEGNYPSYEDVSSSPQGPVNPIPSLQEGQRVRHSKFGEGIIKSIEGERVLVDFEEIGEKLLSLRFAKLEAENH